MNEKIKNKFEWVKNHKKGVIIAGLATVGTVVGGIFLYKNNYYVNVGKFIDNWGSARKVADKVTVSALGTCKVNDIIRYETGTIEMFLDNIPLAEMGKLGEDIIEKIPNLPDNANVWALLSIKDGNIT